jgi:hypothetical protein
MDRRKKQGKGSRRASTAARWLSISAIVTLIAMLALPLGTAAEKASPAAIEFQTCVSLTPSNQVAVTGNNAQVVATVKEVATTDDCTATGAPVQVQVTFTVTGSNAQTSTKTTNTQGQASFTYSTMDVGSDQIVASAGGVDSNTATVNWIDTSATNLDLSPASVNDAVGTDQTWTATVTNADGDPVAGVPVDYEVTGTNPQDPTSAGTTDDNGQVTFTFSGAAAGTDTVTAFADFNDNDTRDTGELSDSAQATWSAAATVTLSPSSLTMATGTALEITATVKDENGDPIQGVTVNYSIAGANPTSGSATTDANGEVTFTDTGAHAGTDTVHATVSGVSTPASATIKWFSGPASLALSASNATPDANTEVTVTGTLTDDNGDGIANVPINFEVTGANATTGTATTDSSGKATFKYTGTTDGADTVNAYADFNGDNTANDEEPTGSTTINWGAAAGIALAPSTQSVQVGNSASVDVTLTNPSGSASGVSVKVEVTGANASTSTVTTDSNGKATISYTGNNTGTDTITAWADLDGNGSQDTGEPSATATVTWTAATPGTFQPAQPASPKAGCTYFPATKHNLCAGFMAYWNKYGGLAVFGMPLTEEFQENGVTTQYFERERFEWHPGAWPERYDVLLGLLGNEVTAGRSTEAPFQRTTAKGTSDCTYYAQTGHNLCAGFQAYWEKYGGLAIYGYPISEEFQEKNPDTGQVYTVQYFERARFEWHPGEWPERFDVELGRLGAQVLKMKYGVSYY